MKHNTCAVCASKQAKPPANLQLVIQIFGRYLLRLLPCRTSRTTATRRHTSTCHSSSSTPTANWRAWGLLLLMLMSWMLQLLLLSRGSTCPVRSTHTLLRPPAWSTTLRGRGTPCTHPLASVARRGRGRGRGGASSGRTWWVSTAAPCPVAAASWSWSWFCRAALVITRGHAAVLVDAAPATTVANHTTGTLMLVVTSLPLAGRSASASASASSSGVCVAWGHAWPHT